MVPENHQIADCLEGRVLMELVRESDIESWAVGFYVSCIHNYLHGGILLVEHKVVVGKV